MKYFTLLAVLLSAFVSADEIRVASWNIYWLGGSGHNDRTSSDYQKLIQYASSLDADVIALQEVEDATWARKVFGDGYNYYFTNRRPDSKGLQRVGFAVRKGISVPDHQDYEQLGLDGSVRFGKDITISTGGGELRLLGVHLKSGCFSASLDSSKKACKKLKRQVPELEEWIDDRAEEGTPYVILGDFNRRLNLDIAGNKGVWEAIDDSHPTEFADLSNLAEDKTSSCWGGKYPQYIDHIVVDPRAKDMYVSNSFGALNFSGQFDKMISDHCPIYATFTF
jgi:exonuclease III